MRFVDQTAAGIDISQDRISIVLLKNGKNGPELLKSASAPMPAGAVKDGNVEDAVLLSKTIRNLKHRNRIRTDRSAVALYAKPVIMQIMDMPKQMPSNIRQYVHGEIRNCVTLPSRDISLDFCGIGSMKRNTDKRFLAVAAESARMAELARVCGRGGFSIETIEPALVAYMRAISSKRLTGKSKCNVLVVVLRGNYLTLCVLKNGDLDFIRNKEIVSADSEDLNTRLAEELSQVVKFYDIEVPENIGKWEIVVLADTIQSPQQVEDVLKSKLQTEHLQVKTFDNAYADTFASGSSIAKDKQPSPVALGLAMGLLTKQKDDLRINLVPEQVERVRETKRDALFTASAVAAILLIMVLAISGFAVMIEKATRKAIEKKNLIAKQDTDTMVDKHLQLDGRVKALSARLDRIGQISASHKDVNWVEVFDEIRNAASASIRITNLSCTDGSIIHVDGLALSNEAVNSFVNLLEKSRIVSSVVLLEARKQEGKNGFITYQLSCKLKDRSVKTGNVG